MKNIVTSFLLIFCLCFTSKAVNPDWMLFNPANSNIPDNFISGFATDNNGNIWLTTWNGFVNFNHGNIICYDSITYNLPAQVYSCIFIDSNVKWLGTYIKGLVKDKDEKSFEVYDPQNSSLPYYKVSEIKKDGIGNLWMVSTDALVKFNGTNWKIFRKEDFKISDQIYLFTQIAVESDSIIWVGTGGGYSYLIRINALDNSFITYRLKDYGYNIMTVVNSIAIDNLGNKWIGTYTGLVKFDNKNFVSYDSASTLISGKKINQLFFDDIGHLWIGTDGSGLVKYDGTNWKNFTVNNSELPDNSIYRLLVDKNFNVFIGTINNGLAVYREGGVILDVEENYTKSDGLINCSPNPVRDILHVDIAIPDFKNIDLSLFDMLGERLLCIENIDLSQDMHSLDIDFTPYTPGTYFLDIYYDNRHHFKKVTCVKY